MRIGVVSDSHGKRGALKNALALLVSKHIDAVLHCGDLCCTSCLRLLDKLDVPAWLVAGNMDSHLDGLDHAVERSAVTFSYSSVEIPLENGAYLVATHGHDEALLASLIGGEHFPYICHGHTHRARDERVGSTRIVCPGALCGPRHPSFPTVALLDTSEDRVTFFNILHPDRLVTV
ncbi:MAG: metallophosphoesterase family protein [Lentisphaerae bacterium]|nr:metallophosphoesterase family protein [Lentisphaerota bacterium]